MPEYLSPGVYVEEVDRGPKPIEAVGTAMAAFVGFTEKADLVREVDGERVRAGPSVVANVDRHVGLEAMAAVEGDDVRAVAVRPAQPVCVSGTPHPRVVVVAAGA